MVLMKENETFPADLAVLSTSNNGNCYIKTSSLDGEKNLKKRFQPVDLNKVVPNNYFTILFTQDLNKTTKEFDMGTTTFSGPIKAGTIKETTRNCGQKSRN